MTGAPFTDPGHRSATPVAVATLWGIQRGTRQVGAAPVTVLPTSTVRTHLPPGKGSDDVTCPSERGTQHARARPQTSPLWGPGLPRAPGPSSVHARTPTRGSETVSHHLRGTKDEIQDDSDARRLPTVYFLQCPTTVPPAIQGKTTTSMPPLMCTAPPCDYKGRRWASFSRVVGSGLSGFYLPRELLALLSTHLNRLHS